MQYNKTNFGKVDSGDNE